MPDPYPDYENKYTPEPDLYPGEPIMVRDSYGEPWKMRKATGKIDSTGGAWVSEPHSAHMFYKMWRPLTQEELNSL